MRRDEAPATETTTQGTNMDFDGMMMFSASKHADREKMSAEVTNWRQRNSALQIVDVRMLQSSDNEFHCVTIAIFYKNKK